MTNNLIGLLAAATKVDPWISDSFPIIRIVLLALAVLCCAVIVVLALVSPAGKQNGNVITGSEQSDTYYSKNKAHMNEGLIKKLMVIFSIAVAVIIILFYVTVVIYPAA